METFLSVCGGLRGQRCALLGSFEVSSERSDFEGGVDGVAMTQSQSKTWCSSMDDGQKWWSEGLPVM